MSINYYKKNANDKKSSGFSLHFAVLYMRIVGRKTAHDGFE